ncbi:MAG: CoA ester lyase [Gammaproteobacteria bacterium]
MISRSWMFVPGDSEKKLGKGASLGADVLILDLEDSVVDSRKARARKMVCEYLQNADRSISQLWVRMNPLDTPHALLDLAGVMQGRPDGLFLPKAGHARDADLLGNYLDALETEHGIERGATKILSLATETPTAMLNISSYTEVNPRLTAVSWGAEDLSAAIGASTNRDEEGNLTSPYILARTLCLMAAYAAGVQAVDTAFTDFKDEVGLRLNCNEARRDGFLGKIAIHPAQIAPINDAFMPSQAEIEHARAVVELFAQNLDEGTLSLDGQMLDKPHLTQAERVLALAAQFGA